MKKINDGVKKRNDELGICLVDNFGYLTIEYYGDDDLGTVVLVESNGSICCDVEIEDIYNNCCNIDDYLQSLVNMKIEDNKRKGIA